VRTARRIIIAIPAGLAFGVALSVAPLVARAQADDAPPAWAYPVNPPDFKSAARRRPRHGMFPTAPPRFTVTQARNMFFRARLASLGAPTATGYRRSWPQAGTSWRAACATGRMGRAGRKNAGIAGLPTQYIVQQMGRLQKRRGGQPRFRKRAPPQLMVKTAKGITDAEIETGGGPIFSGFEAAGDDQGRGNRPPCRRPMWPGGFLADVCRAERD